jgi:uncharacterized membrane protein YgdD (TMEM256/DUF423 family)
MRKFGVAGAVLGLLAVALGAFGAHALRGRLDPADLATLETGVRYQMYHAMALLLVSLLGSRRRTSGFEVAGWGFFLGVVVFSGSLYALVLTGIRWLGAITPLGGVAFMIGWIAVGWGLLTAERTEER